MNDKQKEFISSVIKIILAITIAGMAGGKFFGLNIPVFHYPIYCLFALMLVLAGIIINKE